MIFGIIAAIILIVIGGLLIYVGLFRDSARAGIGFVVSGLVVAVLGLLCFGLVNIGPGHVGVVTVFGHVQDQEMPPGIHWRMPFVNSVIVMDTRVQRLREENYSAASREQQDLFLNITLNYHLDPQAASDVVQNVGTDYADKIIRPRFLDIPKSVTDDYTTATVLGARDEIAEAAEALLAAELEPFGIIVDNIALENFSYSPEFNAAIEERAIAEQAVETRQQELEQARVRAQQRVVEAEGVADARIAEAEGEAEANRLLNESLSEQLLQWQAIQRLNDNVQIMLVPSDQGFIIDLQGLQSPPPAPSDDGN